MAIDLRLKNRTDQVFSEYEEKFVGNSIVFEGCLLPHNVRARDTQIVRFVSGGRRYLTYDLDRDGGFVRGVIRYRALDETDPESIEKSIAETEHDIAKDNENPKSSGAPRAADDEIVDRIRALYEGGASLRSIAKEFYLSYKTVNFIVNKKGAYAE